MEYRRRKGRDTWHWRPECSNWPVLSYDSCESARRPRSGELCNPPSRFCLECRAKERREKARKGRG